VSLRLIGHGIPQRPRVPDRIVVGLSPGAGAPPARRRVYFGATDGWQETPIFRRADFSRSVAGPAIVEEYDATCVVPPRARAQLDAYGNIVIDLSSSI
jgi:N-methylhydantoinase A